MIAMAASGFHGLRELDCHAGPARFLHLRGVETEAEIGALVSDFLADFACFGVHNRHAVQLEEVTSETSAI